MPGTIPGSYFIPPVTLPGGATPLVQPNQGFSMDYTGFPNPGGIPGSTAGGHTPFARPGQPPTTPYMGAGTQTGYSTFQQPLPPGGMPPPMYPMGMGMGMPGGMQGGMPPFATPYMPMGMPPGMMGGMGGMGGIPGAMPAGYPFTPAAPNAPMPGAVPMQPQHSRDNRFPNPKEKQPWDQAEFVKFAEGDDYGPVLSTMLVHRMKAKIEVNPLILPPNDALDRDYLKWNMLFPTGNCQRSSDRPGRSWYNGRNAPATWPRVKSLRLISRAFPWSIDVPATSPEVGVTCGDVIEAVHTSMYTRLSQQQYDNASRQQRRLLSESFYHNRSTAHGVPGGRLQQTLLRCDWLGQDTMFGGIVDDERFVRDVCGDHLPCTFELKCVRRYPMTEAEIREQEAREREEEERVRRRSRSRATSRAGSSRPPTRPPSRVVDDSSSSSS
ncbi:hypothetical protein BD309DRAFT_868466 [Dichomitus squalens]|nr:uncharacterized protein DICSQDRAFT_135712 [Dichomitus squalens LYAD-421 SS1]EJF62752.1 hypothetical protein DICSQDRAFT_135712 [Dichomitus squalens LYAD-421 SS1]TBU41359.1 hypothetical protein BD309DRAFT_868466 [Dichomitus squalens]